MTPTHDSFTITRRMNAAPARVFACWADPDLKRRWFADHDGPDWTTLDYGLDFRVGGREFGKFRMNASEQTPMAGLHENETVYLDIEPDARIVTAYSMAKDGKRHSASLATTTFQPDGDGCLMTYTEQIAQLDGTDGSESRRTGCSWLFDALETVLKETRP